VHPEVVSWPPKEDQSIIANYLDQQTNKIDQMVGKVKAAIEKLTEYRSALITDAVIGRIDVRNAGGQVNARSAY
jgi:type I restriction enzyme, S subunit